MAQMMAGANLHARRDALVYGLASMGALSLSTASAATAQPLRVGLLIPVSGTESWSSRASRRPKDSPRLAQARCALETSSAVEDCSRRSAAIKEDWSWCLTSAKKSIRN